MSDVVERIRAYFNDGEENREDIERLFAAYDEQAERIARLEAERRGLWEDVEAWRTASGLVGVHPSGCEGDPGDVEPRHLQAYLDAQEARVERLRAVALTVRESCLDAELPNGRAYHGAEKHSDDWHDGFEVACRLWLRGPVLAALAALHPGDLDDDAPAPEVPASVRVAELRAKAEEWQRLAGRIEGYAAADHADGDEHGAEVHSQARAMVQRCTDELLALCDETGRET